MEERSFFRLCSTCKTHIAFEERYYSCSVSTCNKKATALFFCSVPCWDAHVPEARHRDAWAEVETAPTREAWNALQKNDAPPKSSEEPKPQRRVVSSAGSTMPSSSGTTTVSNMPVSSSAAQERSEEHLATEDLPQDVLVVMSKLKNYVKARAGLNTSDAVSAPLSEHLRQVTDAAIRSARANGRKTILARDVDAALRGQTAND